MIYRSNLTAPDLQPYFRHTVCRVMSHSLGHDVLSDFADSNDPQLALYRNCGFLTHDEAAILYIVARQIGGKWLDIGAHTGWTAANMAVAGCEVTALEPMLAVPAFGSRMAENLSNLAADFALNIQTVALRSNQYFESPVDGEFRGIFIDGDHDSPCPVEDARNADAHLAPGGVILFHDAIGRPVQDAAMELVRRGYRCRVYSTPHVMAICWRGNFEPPIHTPDRYVRQQIAGYLGALERFRT